MNETLMEMEKEGYKGWNLDTAITECMVDGFTS